ncbi:MAG TPA: hypothetical protein VFF18_16595 [Woeseiaceae bacterium]|nr:hypothetical protein [Woeseiaceae bacterium]
MNEENDPVTFLLGLAEGRWQGEEEVLADPAGAQFIACEQHV